MTNMQPTRDDNDDARPGHAPYTPGGPVTSANRLTARRIIPKETGVPRQLVNRAGNKVLERAGRDPVFARLWRETRQVPPLDLKLDREAFPDTMPDYAPRVGEDAPIQHGHEPDRERISGIHTIAEELHQIRDELLRLADRLAKLV